MDEIIKYYNAQNEDGRLTIDRSHGLEYLTTMRYIEKVCASNSKILDACAGTGAYCFELALKGHKVIAGDLIPSNVKFIEMKNKKQPILDNIYTGNILDLSNFQDDSFDVTLCLGALYHLHDMNDREQALLECKRVTKTNGLIFVAYLNRFASFMNNFTYHPDNFDTIMQEFRTGNKEVFYRSTPVEMEQQASKLGISKLYNIGTDGVAFMYPEQLEGLSKKQYEKYLEYHFDTCEDEHTLGYSLHGLYIGRKQH